MAQATRPAGFYRQNDGHHETLVCDGVPLAAIASAEGTPLYVYSAAVLRDRYRAIDAAFGEYPHAVHYALKANSALAIVRLHGRNRETWNRTIASASLVISHTEGTLLVKP